MPDPRVPITVRLSPAGLARIDALTDGRDRSSVVRALLAEALTTPTVLAAVKRRLTTESAM